jgi:hypothetical protein
MKTKTSKTSSNKSSKGIATQSKTNTSNAQGVKVAKTRTVGAHVPASQQCEHKSAKHHSRGKCVMCYNAARNKKSSRPTAKSAKAGGGK